jgi:hypothetical protein
MLVGGCKRVQLTTLFGEVVRRGRCKIRAITVKTYSEQSQKLRIYTHPFLLVKETRWNCAHH